MGNDGMGGEAEGPPSVLSKLTGALKEADHQGCMPWWRTLAWSCSCVLLTAPSKHGHRSPDAVVRMGAADK
jgi:hypothetical protein